MILSRRCTVRSQLHSATSPNSVCLVGHYLNLPVVEADGRLVAIVDVLKLTYATLEQVSIVYILLFHLMV